MKIHELKNPPRYVTVRNVATGYVMQLDTQKADKSMWDAMVRVQTERWEIVKTSDSLGGDK